MYIINGVAYAGRQSDNIEVSMVRPLEDMMMILTFSNGEKRLFDASSLTGSAFEPLKNPEIFKTATIEYGAVIWMDGEIDCAPEFMYQHSYQYSDIAL